MHRNTIFHLLERWKRLTDWAKDSNNDVKEKNTFLVVNLYRIGIDISQTFQFAKWVMLLRFLHSFKTIYYMHESQFKVFWIKLNSTTITILFVTGLQRLRTYWSLRWLIFSRGVWVWCSQNELSLSPNRAKTILVTRKISRANLKDLFFNGSQIPKVKYLWSHVWFQTELE